MLKGKWKREKNMAATISPKPCTAKGVWHVKAKWQSEHSLGTCTCWLLGFRVKGVESINWKSEWNMKQSPGEVMGRV